MPLCVCSCATRFGLLAGLCHGASLRHVYTSLGFGWAGLGVVHMPVGLAVCFSSQVDWGFVRGYRAWRAGCACACACALVGCCPRAPYIPSAVFGLLSLHEPGRQLGTTFGQGGWARRPRATPGPVCSSLATGVAVSHRTTWFQTQPILATCQIRFHAIVGSS